MENPSPNPDKTQRISSKIAPFQENIYYRFAKPANIYIHTLGEEITVEGFCISSPSKSGGFEFGLRTIFHKEGSYHSHFWNINAEPILAEIQLHHYHNNPAYEVGIEFFSNTKPTTKSIYIDQAIF